MFKRSKNRKPIVPPGAPTLEEIMSDIETFHVETRPTKLTINQPLNSMEAWWTSFEKFLRDLEDLQVIDTEIADMKSKLKSRKLEIEMQTRKIQKDIKCQQEIIESIIE